MIHSTAPGTETQQASLGDPFCLSDEPLSLGVTPRVPSLHCRLHDHSKAPLPQKVVGSSGNMQDTLCSRSALKKQHPL